MKKRESPVDWELIEKLYRAGVLSIREIGKVHDVSDKAIRNKAKEFGWERDLTEKVAEKVRTELVRTQVRTKKGDADQKQSEREIIEEAAATVVQVVRSHRAQIRQGIELSELLTKQLTDVAGRRDEFEQAIEISCAEDSTPEKKARLMHAVSLDKHAVIATNLANAAKTWITLERQAFSIADTTSTDAPDNDTVYSDTELAVRMAYIMGKAKA